MSKHHDHHEPDSKHGSLQQRRNIKDAYIQLVKDELKPNYVIAVNFNLGNVSQQFAEKKIVLFLNMIQRKVLGSRWHKKPGKLRLRAVGFAELLLTRPHYHILVRTPDDEWNDWKDALIKEGCNIWKVTVPSGDAKVQPIRDQEGVLSYVTKEQTRFNQLEWAIFYTPPKT